MTTIYAMAPIVIGLLLAAIFAPLVTELEKFEDATRKFRDGI